MLIRLTPAVFLVFLVMVTATATAGDEVQEKENRSSRPMTQEEIDRSIGRYGETDPVPENFQFSKAENLLWLNDHLHNIDRPMRLYYAFNRSGSYEEGFSDSVYLDIVKINDDGSKDAILDFFTGGRKQNISSDNVMSIKGNPVLGVYMQGDVYEMNRLTEGHWRYFQKRIKIALRESAKVDEVDFDFNGKHYKGEKIVFMPYLHDPHRADFEKFANKRYEFIMSEDVPGTLYQIRTVIPDGDGQENGKQPLIEETLTLMETKYGH